MIRSLFSPLLFLLSGLYFCLIFIRKALYKLGLLKVKKLDRPVISIGNISVGGSGKTAAVLEILRQVPDLCVLTRGYKSNVLKNKKVPCLVETAESPNLFGDEPSLIKSKHPAVSIVIDPNRYRGGQYALTKNKNIKAFLLDDGFQHLKLHRDLDILIFDLDIYLKKPGLLPLGNFREELSALRRADLVLISKWSHLSKESLDQAILKLKSYNEKIELMASKITEIKNIKNESIKSGRCILVSGLGQPDVFESDLRSAFGSLEILEHIKYKDHYKYTDADIQGLVLKSQKSAALIICSEKDFIKIKSLGLNLDMIYFTHQEVELTNKCINKVLKVIETKRS
jgi:tetraacyldisaccharide 4'-kinase